MNIPIYGSLLVLIIVALATSGVDCNCGCLKCSKHLKVVSPPCAPVKIIYRQPLNASPCPAFQKPLPYTVQVPLAPAPLPVAVPLPPISYRIVAPRPQECTPERLYKYQYQVQVPIAPPPIPPLIPLTGLISKTDRIVVPAPDCPEYRQAPQPVFAAPQTQQLIQVEVAKPSGPIIEQLPEDFYIHHCDCRYDHHRRKKRQIPIVRDSIDFLMGLLPTFLGFPVQQTQKAQRYFQRNTINPRLGLQKIPHHHKPHKPLNPYLFMNKLQTLNREKRSIVFDDDQLSLPFLRVTGLENDDDNNEYMYSTEDEDEIDYSEEAVENLREQYLKPLNFNHIVPHNPIFYMLNTPIRLLHHFHKLGRQMTPIVTSVPHVLINSRKYLRNFGKTFKNDLLDFASNMIGDFDDLNQPFYHQQPPRRYRRDLKGLPSKHRSKRYILKVVDEDEVESFLREKLGHFVEPPKPKKRESGRKRLLVEKLSPKLIIDNNGRPFYEINGFKRPIFPTKAVDEVEAKPSKTEDKVKKFESLGLFWKKSTEETTKAPEKPEEPAEKDTDNTNDKITELIEKAKEKINQNCQISHNSNELSTKIIKERIGEVLTEIENLINLDFDRYAKIHTDLVKLQTFKNYLVADWLENLSNEPKAIHSKIRILNDFQELQILRDVAVVDIVNLLKNGTNFMTKKLIRMLVRLQKLQCITNKVIDEFGEKIQSNLDFDSVKEVKYLEYLQNLDFVTADTKHDLEQSLKVERDETLEVELAKLDGLKNLLERNDLDKQYTEAKIVWEIKNAEKLQKETIEEMNKKVCDGQKIRKELKILFDLQRQLERSEEKQSVVLEKESKPSSMEQSDAKSIKVLNVVDLSSPHKTIIDDKKPIRLISNGYTLTAYKVNDAFD